MRALLCAALVFLWAQCIHGFAFSPGSYREARQNYYEVINNCEKEGGECLDVDFGTTDPPTPDPTPAPRPTTTRAPPPPAPVTQQFFWYPFWPFIPTPQAPFPSTRAPRPTTRAPRPTTRAPRPTTRAPRPTTQAPVAVPPKPVKAPVKAARKIKKGGKGKRRQRNQGEVEREVRKRRQAFNPDPWDYLYNECTGGWEFDLGCGARGGNVCCYSSSSGNPYK
ncbi:uncharacterized protein LOC123527515 [Mercenaria mercenaria]|uniref:uncharacterized protein LOC123527515 n=1 Tax=Mercenaria mercenaria TaxID=6596 RepID=UPI00234F2E35|nr:uncharacterized protein LOC123527515 [Mercenaria mercenaria]